MRKKLVLVLLLMISGICYGSGYALYEMNSAAHGMAQAYTCRVEDPSAIWYNPAALSRLEGNEIVLSTTWIGTSRDFTPILSDTTIESPTVHEFPFHFFWGRPLSDRFFFGVGLYQPFGFQSQWPEGSPASLVSTRTKLQTYYVTPSFAYRFHPYLAAGGGVDFIYGKMDMQHQIRLDPFPYIFNEINTDGTEFSFNLGALIETAANWNFAITYKHRVDLDLDGDTIFTGVPVAFRRFYPDNRSTVRITLPSQVTLGASTTFEDWYLEGNLVFTRWDDVDTIGVDFQENTALLRDLIIRRFYKDSWALRIGAEYSLTDHTSLRVGFLHDETPVPDQAVDPFLPDGTRNGLSVGAGYNSETWKLDAGYTILFIEDRTSPLNNFQDPPLNGLVAGGYESSSHLFSIGFGYKF